MGPIRRFSGMVDDVREQQARLRTMIDRIREANDRLTGSTGQPPTNIKDVGGADRLAATPPQPLLVELTVTIERGAPLLDELLAEIEYFETFSETQRDQAEISIKAAHR